MSHKIFGPDRFSRFDVYWIQTDRQTDKQTSQIYIYIKAVFELFRKNTQGAGGRGVKNYPPPNRDMFKDKRTVNKCKPNFFRCLTFVYITVFKNNPNFFFFF